VLQFFDVAGKFTLKAAEIYRSKGNQDGPSNLRRLSRISTDLQALFEKLQTPLSDSPASEVPQLSSLSTECSHLIEEVLQKLEKIGVGNRERRMDLILSEFKATWQGQRFRGSRIVELQRQFLALRRAGALPLQASLERRSLWSCALLTHRELSFVFSLGASLPPFLPNQVTLQLHFRCSQALRSSVKRSTRIV